MDAFQLAWVAYHGLLLLIAFAALGVEAAKRPAAEPVAVVYVERAVSPPDTAWQFSMPDPDEHLLVRQ